MHAVHPTLAFAHFDRDLRRLPPTARARPWLAMYLRLCTDQGNAMFCEIRTRFHLLADGRLRRQSLAVAKRVKAVQRAWHRDLRLGPRTPVSSAPSPTWVPPVESTDDNVERVVVDQVLLDPGLER